MPPIGTLRRIADPTLPKTQVALRVVEDIKPTSLFEEPKPVDTRRSTLIPQMPTVAGLPAILFPVMGIVAGLIILWFGIFNAGSFYGTSSRFSGALANLFYVWQVGNVLEIIGVVAVYHNVLNLWDVYRNGR
jgi:hypothetical protein